MNGKQIDGLVFVVTCLFSLLSIKPVLGSYIPFEALAQTDGGQRASPEQRQGSSTSDPFHKDFVCNNDANPVVGGEEAEPFSQPWMAYISAQIGYKHGRCAGTVISDQWVICAGHCFELDGRRASSAWVTLAVHDVSNKGEENALVLKVSGDQIYIHNNYDGIYLRNDVALLQLPEKIPSDNRHIRPACLPINREDPSYGETCVASGWGQKSTVPMMFSDKLLTIDVEIARCEPIQPDNICSRKPRAVTKDQDTCVGDSGGPLIYEAGEVATIVGVLSSGSAECQGRQQDIPSTYTRLSFFLDWIKRTIQKNMKYLEVKPTGKPKSSQEEKETTSSC